MFALILLLAINFAISWSNATYCGRYWSEAKYTGGFFQLNVVCGYIMAITGFTMVYGCILFLIAPYILPLIPAFKNVDMTQLLELSSNMLYLLIVLAIIPTGFFIWFQSITVFWKKKTLSNGLTAGWNTYAQLSNTINACRNVPSAFGRVTEALFGGGKGKRNSKKSDGTIIILAIFIVIMAICGGYFTASAIMKKADREYDALAEMGFGPAE